MPTCRRQPELKHRRPLYSGVCWSPRFMLPRGRRQTSSEKRCDGPGAHKGIALHINAIQLAFLAGLLNRGRSWILFLPSHHLHCSSPPTYPMVFFSLSLSRLSPFTPCVCRKRGAQRVKPKRSSSGEQSRSSTSPPYDVPPRSFSCRASTHSKNPS